ncbi:hypothetical protein FALBO_15136 [Fusarium albosuccineum]|uniref:C6 zinc finger domain protein n=1 Tax=Fusarium albosuccineum TaxID=1237068 RepID=A0A8H4KX58_9HYPO|nr:hypothetical protein FALBO_15136 [Fusarium albosuccineum]
MAQHEEKRYFDFFRVVASSKLSGVFPSRFWESLVLQASSSEAMILHGASALGAVYKSKSHDLCDGMLQHHVSATTTIRDGQRFALKQYAKVLDMLQTQLPRTDFRWLRNGLITCVLITALELVQGNHKAATTHLKNGFKLVRRAQSYGFTLEPDLAEPFTRACMQSIILDGSSRDWIDTVVDPLWESPAIPQEFTSLSEARSHLEALLMSAVRLAETFEAHDHGRGGFPTDIAQQQAVLERASSCWLQAYEASLHVLLSQSNHRTIYGVYILRMFHTMVSIMISTAMDAPFECPFDRYTEQFAAIIGQTLRMWDMNGFAVGRPFEGHRKATGPRVTFDPGIISPLYYTAVKCRDPGLRRQAIGLLTVAPYREGVWSSIVVARIARAVVEMEEDGFYDGVSFATDALAPVDPETCGRFPPLLESSRFHTVRVSISEEAGGRRIFTCSKASSGGRGYCDETTVEFNFTDE